MNEHKIAEEIASIERHIAELEDKCRKLKLRIAESNENHIPANLELDLKKCIQEIDKSTRTRNERQQKLSQLRLIREKKEEIERNKPKVYRYLNQIKLFIECDDPIDILYGIYLFEILYHNKGQGFPDEMKKVILLIENRVKKSNVNPVVAERFQISRKNLHQPTSNDHINITEADLPKYTQKRIKSNYLKALQELLQSNYHEALKLIYPINQDYPGYIDSINITAVINNHYDIEKVYCRGIHELEQKSYAQAIKTFTEVADIDPDYKDTQSKLSFAQEKDKKKEINDEEERRAAEEQAKRDEIKFLYLYSAIVVIFSLPGYLFLRDIKFYIPAPAAILLFTLLGEWWAIGISLLNQSRFPKSLEGVGLCGLFIAITTSAIILTNIIAPGLPGLIALCLPILVSFLFFKHPDPLIKRLKRPKGLFNSLSDPQIKSHPSQRDQQHRSNQDTDMLSGNIFIIFVIICGLVFFAGKDYVLLFANQAKKWPGEWGYIATFIVNGIIVLILLGMPLLCLFKRYHLTALPVYGITIMILLILVFLQTILPTYPKSAITLNWLVIIGGAVYANAVLSHAESAINKTFDTR